MRTTTQSLATCVLLATASSWAGTTAAADTEVLYQATFNNAGDAGKPLADFGWAYHLGPQGWNEANNGATQGLVSADAGGGDAAPSGFVVNALGPDGAGADTDPYWNQLTHYATNDLTIDPKAMRISAVAFDLLLSQPDDVRLTVKIGDAWFASQQTFTGPTAEGTAIYDFANRYTTHRLEFQDAQWLPMNFVPNTTMGLDTSQPADALPNGTLNGVGLLLQPTGYEAFDNVTIFGQSR